MNKLRVTASKAQKEELLEQLLVLGCIEISEPDELMADPEFAALVSREAVKTDALRASAQSIARALDVLGRYAPAKSPMFITRTDISWGEFLCEDKLEECLGLAARLDSLDSRIRYAISEETRENALIEALLPWAPHDLPLDFEGTKTSAVLLGSVAASVDFFALERAVSDAVPEANVALVSSDESRLYVCVIYLREKLVALSDALHEFGFTVPASREITGTASKEIAQSNKRISDSATTRERLMSEIMELAERREDFIRCADLLVTKSSRAAAEERFISTASSVTFTGWIPEESTLALKETLEAYACAYWLTEPTPEEYPIVPVELKNNGFTRPLSMVTEMYSLPAYDGIDPNPVMAPFFILFYGMMMADMGYGLVMILAALFVKKKKPKGGMRNFFDLMFLCGISTFVIGIFTGGFFGDAPSQIAGLFGGRFEIPALINTVEHATYILVASFALGGIHIITGMAVKLIHQIRTGNALDGILDVVPWWTLFAGIAFAALGVTWVVAIVGVVLIIATQGRDKPTIFGKIFGGIGSLYDITAYFGDVLSYARLMALMLAGGVIANVFNTVGALTGNIVTFLIIFIIGHALNMGLNLLGCYVHDLRLQCLEFFGKFYQDGGKPFKPLSINSKYVNIINK